MTSGTSCLSERAVEALAKEVNWRDLRKTLANPYDKETQPDGRINMGLAESSLMHKELIEHVKSNFHIDPAAHLTYGQGPKGSPRLIKALTRFLNTRFKPIALVAEDELMITTGVASAIDSLTWCICNEGDGILTSQPLYAGFLTDVELRSRGKLLPVSYRRDDRGYNALDLFDAQANREALERALKEYSEGGTRVRAVLLSNPHNPLGRCYSEDTLKEIARFCRQYDLHLISDEIYAMSTFQNPSFPEADVFRSVLSINMTGIMDPNRLHVFYGMSKDFCANGMRLGVLQTRNTDLLEVATSINQFSWPAYANQDIWARILVDDTFLDNFITVNHQRLAHHYTKFTSFLEQYEIPYLKGGNSGFFIWTRLIREPSTRSPAAAQKSVATLKAELLETCHKNGLFIRDGKKYFAEELDDGWFRITFTVDEHVLSVATDRLLRSLEATGLL